MRNDGTGHFADVTATTMPADPTSRRGLAVADVDRDGDLDIMLSASSGPLSLYLNNGSGSFVNVTSTQMPALGDTNRIVLVDLDGDSAPEAIVEDGDNSSLLPIRVLHNDGAGRFTDATSTLLAPLFASRTNGFAAVDIDTDGRLDLYVAHSWPYDGLYRTTGTAAWSTCGRPKFRIVSDN